MTPYYQDDLTTLYHGDCRELLPSIEADVLVTDPPYGLDMRAFVDDFTVVTMLDSAPGLLLASFMSPRRAMQALLALPSWTFERLLWMHKSADIAAPWRGWCMNSEAILVLSRRGAVWPKPKSYRSDMYSVGPWERDGHHPNAKPLVVVADLVERLSLVTGTVLDPFAGSGTTLVAAKSLNRRSIGIEIEERYCEVAATRLRQEVLGLAG